VALLQSEHAQSPALYGAAQRLAPSAELAGLALRIGDATEAAWGDCTQLIEDGGTPALQAPAGVFVQANPAVADALRRSVLALCEAEPESVLELYAGCGTLTLALAAHARSVVAVEADARAAQARRDNVARRGLTNIRVRCEDAATAAAGERVDCVVLDPPRRGARDALAGIVQRKPKRIVYASCDPTTLGRDLEQLTAEGYTLDAIRALDMFPHTPHVECVVRLRR
jgi:23S rRNA (uracil1939-C5)-methyltransferase